MPGGPDPDFKNYWTQLTPENAGKWGSVATSPDTSAWNWGGFDASYNYAQSNHLFFKEHCLIWGHSSLHGFPVLILLSSINILKLGSGW